RVQSGEIPREWLSMIDGKPLGGEVHPSLATLNQICLGNPQVVRWLKEQLTNIIEKWNLEWIKWDPSGTTTYACNRSDHGHGPRNGLQAAYKGYTEILAHLLDRFPNLIGFENSFSLRYARVNPVDHTTRNLLPGGYVNEFITGPMVSPNVWGSLAAAGEGDAQAARLTGRWYSASALDYH